MSCTYSHPHAGTVQSGSNRCIARCPAAATAGVRHAGGRELLALAEHRHHGGCRRADEGEVRDPAAEARGQRPAEHPPTAVADQGDGTARRRPAGVGRPVRSVASRRFGTAGVDRQRRARRPVAHAPQPVPQRPQVQVVPEQARARRSPAGRPHVAHRAPEHRPTRAVQRARRTTWLSMRIESSRRSAMRTPRRRSVGVTRPANGAPSPLVASGCRGDGRSSGGGCAPARGSRARHRRRPPGRRAPGTSDPCGRRPRRSGRRRRPPARRGRHRGAGSGCGRGSSGPYVKLCRVSGAMRPARNHGCRRPSGTVRAGWPRSSRRRRRAPSADTYVPSGCSGCPTGASAIVYVAARPAGRRPGQVPADRGRRSRAPSPADGAVEHDAVTDRGAHRPRVGRVAGVRPPRRSTVIVNRSPA